MAQSQHDKLFARALLMLQSLKEESKRSVISLAEEFGVDKRTIYRDVERLHFFPIELVDGYVCLSEDYDVTAPSLVDDELLLTELAFSAIAGIDEGTDKKIHGIRAKLTHPLFFNPYKIQPEGFEAIDTNSEILNKIEDAIEQKNISKLMLNAKTIEVEPYRVVAFDGIWYLFAKDMDDAKIKTYLISRIEEFRASTKTFKYDKERINTILAGVHTAWFEDGNSFSVKVKIKKEIAHYFKLKKFLHSQEIKEEQKDGSLIVTFRVSSDEDVDNLIKAWLPHIEVVSPLRFRQRIATELEQYLKELKQNLPSV